MASLLGPAVLEDEKSKAELVELDGSWSTAGVELDGSAGPTPNNELILWCPPAVAPRLGDVSLSSSSLCEARSRFANGEFFMPDIASCRLGWFGSFDVVDRRNQKEKD